MLIPVFCGAARTAVRERVSRGGGGAAFGIFVAEAAGLWEVLEVDGVGGGGAAAAADANAERGEGGFIVCFDLKIECFFVCFAC